jgi:fermentation-respiration switch protein FrsA (DUF1100 family)
LIAALLLFGAVAASAWILGSILVHPANHTVQWPPGFERLRFDANPVSIPGSGHEIAGWWINSGSSSPAVILLHAVRADRATMVSRAQLLKNHGFSVLLIDLQAHGETPGQAITFGALESADVVAAHDWLKHINPERRIGVVGCSLGGAAVLLGPQPSGFDAVVLEAVYPRITRAVENRIRIRAGRMTSVLAPLLLMQLKPRLHIAPSDLAPIKSINRLGAPVLIAAGSDDEHTTLPESEELYAAAANPKELWIVKGAHHQDLLAFNTEEYEAHVVRFLIAHLRSTPQFEPERLNKSQLEKLFTVQGTLENPITFVPNQGVRRCCNLGDPELQFRPDGMLQIYMDGYAPTIERLPYSILADGKIMLGMEDNKQLADWLRQKNLHNAYVFHYGPDLFLVRDSEAHPDLGFQNGSLWPFKAGSPSKW